MTPRAAWPALLVVLAFATWPAAASAGTAPPAESPRTAAAAEPDVAGRVASLVESFPADTPAARDALCAQILALGPQAAAAVFARVQAPGQGDDSKARFAANGLVVYAGRSAVARERTLVLTELASALARAREANVGTFFLSQLQLLGGRESLRTIARYLADEALAAPATAAAVAIGGPEAARALLAALDKAPAGARVSIVDGLGRLRSPQAVRPLLALADSPEPATRQAALAALAASGDPAAAAALSRSRVDAGYRERAQAPALYLQYARRLVESGHAAEGLAAARAVLDGYRRPGESQHAAEALALIVSARRDQALPDLLAASEAQDRTLGAALALASRIPGPAATARWVEKASAAPPERRAEIVVMLGERGDAAALPLLRDSLRSEDKLLRLAAAPAAARLGGEAVLSELFERLGAADAEECAVLERVLLGYPAASVTPRALALLDAAPLPAKAVLIRLLGEKRARDASERIYRLAEDAEPATREAALVALASLAGEADVPRLVALLDTTTAGDDAVRLREAITAAVLRSPDPERRADGLLQLLRKAPPAGKVAILRLLPRIGGAGPLRAVAQESASADAEVQAAAIGALARWPDSAAAGELWRIASASPGTAQGRSALQGYVRVVGRSEQPAYEKIAAFEQALGLPAGDAERKAVFSAITSLREPESLRLLGRCLDKPELHDAAAAALLELASRQEPDERWLSGHEAYSLLRRAEASLSEPAARERAATIIAERLKQGGFVPLFDGRSLDGWKGLVETPARAKLGRDELAKAQAAADERMREHWKAAGGVLTFDGKGENLCTARDYGDFELLVDWKIEKGGDSGLYLRGTPQVQIWDAEANPAGSGGLYNNEKGKSQPLEKADRPTGEWNAFRVVMIGERVTVYLNDKRVVDETVLENYWQRDKPIYGSGPIELQAHGNPLAFRNLYVREIPRDAASQAAASADGGEGFVPLFNGRDLDGWTGNVEGYAVENGRIVVHPERAGGNLYTSKEYSDFVLRFEFKLTPAANNGIGVRAPLEGDAAYAGLELQVLEDGSPVYWDLQPYQYHGSVYGVVPARRGVLRPIGEWNTEEVTVQGRRVAVTVNGVTVVDADLDAASANGTLDHKEHPGLKRTTGHIGFLGHGSIVEFRNLRIRELR